MWRCLFPRGSNCCKLASCKIAVYSSKIELLEAELVCWRVSNFQLLLVGKNGNLKVIVSWWRLIISSLSSVNKDRLSQVVCCWCILRVGANEYSVLFGDRNNWMVSFNWIAKVFQQRIARVLCLPVVAGALYKFVATGIESLNRRLIHKLHLV